MQTKGKTRASLLGSKIKGLSFMLPGAPLSASGRLLFFGGLLKLTGFLGAKTIGRPFFSIKFSFIKKSIMCVYCFQLFF